MLPSSKLLRMSNASILPNDFSKASLLTYLFQPLVTASRPSDACSEVRI